jgi:hypothetical protein
MRTLHASRFTLILRVVACFAAFCTASESVVAGYYIVDNEIQVSTLEYNYRMIFFTVQSPDPPERVTLNEEDEPDDDAVSYVYDRMEGYPPYYATYYYDVDVYLVPPNGQQVNGLFGVTQRRHITDFDEEDWEIAPGTSQYNPVWIP